jgi:hypothetical protein
MALFQGTPLMRILMARLMLAQVKHQAFVLKIGD